MPEFEPIIGRFFSVGIDGAEHRVYVEEAGKGIPLLCLHTAGADSRQYRHLLNDTAVTERFRVFAFDLPYHGRSTPPDGWWLKKYRLTTASYLEMIRAVWLTLGLERPVVMGCSMGGAIALKVAAEYQDELTGSSGSKARPTHRGAITSCFIILPSTAASWRRATPTASTGRSAQKHRGARTGGTTATPGPASIRAKSTSTHGLGWPRQHQAHRYQPLHGGAAHRRIRLFLHAGHERGGGCGRSRVTPHHHEGHGAFPNGRELSGIPTPSVGGARSRGGVSRTPPRSARSTFPVRGK
jgi:pimeloyl-ACP methyl ester carboxylesterase